MVEQKPSFDIYKAFATTVFETGVHENKPPRMAKKAWEEHINEFAVLAFNEEVRMSDIGVSQGITTQAVQCRRVRTQNHLLGILPEEYDSVFSQEALVNSFPTRTNTLTNRRVLNRRQGGVVSAVMEIMDKGATYEEAMTVLTNDKELRVSGIRRRLRELEYTVPETNIGRLGKRRALIENPSTTSEELKKYFSEMSISCFNNFSKGENSTLVSFFRTFQSFGVKVNPRAKEEIRLLEEKLFEKGIVIGQLPFMPKQPDGTYKHFATYHYHRRIDVPKIEEQKDFMMLFLNGLKSMHSEDST